jgi:hypothetical protein
MADFALEGVYRGRQKLLTSVSSRGTLSSIRENNQYSSTVFVGLIFRITASRLEFADARHCRGATPCQRASWSPEER